MREEVLKVKKIADCQEIASVDCYDEDELTAGRLVGWLGCLEVAFDEVDDLEVMGEIVQYKGFKVQGNQILVKVRRNSKNACVAIDSVKLLNSAKHQKIWMMAYQKYMI